MTAMITRRPNREMALFCVNISRDPSRRVYRRRYSTSVILTFWAGEGPNEDNSNDHEGTQWYFEPVRTQLSKTHACLTPHPMHRPCDDGEGNMEEKNSQGNGQPKEKWLQPACSRTQGVVHTMEDESGNPPAREYEPYEQVKKQPISSVEIREGMGLGILF